MTTHKTAPRLPPAVPRSGVSAEARLALRRLLADDLRDLAAAFRNGGDASELARARSRSVEAVIAHVWVAVLGAPADMALFAVGGFGRRMLFPYSDVDLLVLARDAAVAPAMEQFFGVLWDIGLRPGHALRTPAQCRELGARDARVFTSLLDAHLIAGDTTLRADLDAIIDAPDVWPAAEYLGAKRAEQAERFARHAGTSHNLEPNLKEGPGGLRALDLMRWLGRRVVGADDLAALLAAGLLDEAERDALIDAEKTLRRYRFALHLAAGRAEERLLFDYQRSLATSLDFEDEHDGNLGVEQFMQGYYRAAIVVDRIGAQWLARCEELLAPANGPGRPLDADFLVLGGRVAARDPQVFVRRPRALVDAFAVGLDHADVHGHSAATMRAIHQGLLRHGATLGACRTLVGPGCKSDCAVHTSAASWPIEPLWAGEPSKVWPHTAGFSPRPPKPDRLLADDPDVLTAFLELLRRGAAAVDALVGMNRHGVLAAIVPAFARVVGRMQYDLFHIYTVDEHTLRVLQQLARFADPAAHDEFPIASAAWAQLDRPELLLLAALFHDIAKGRGGDHSVLGETEARAFCVRLGLTTDDAEQVAWLVRWHLRMSVTAQRQDIADPAVVTAFAAHVGDRVRLDQLYLLTVADIVGTSPRLWNTWKDRLLADLYNATRFALRAGLPSPPHAEARIRACREAAAALLADVDPAAVAVHWRDLPERVFLRLRPEQVARYTRLLLDAADAQRLCVSVQRAPIRGGTELLVHAAHRDGLFAAITAILDRLRFSVVAARIVATRPGMVLDAFTLLDADTEAPAAAARCAELEVVLTRTLHRPIAEVRTARRRLPRRLRHFQRPPRIEYRELGEDRLQLALVASDRPGLLAQVAQALREARVRVHDARIATFGERVEDFFEISDEHDRVPSPAIQAKLHGLLLRRLGAPTEPTKETDAST